ncbi:hypothetical protein [Micromonospora sp. WMMC273]|uniref:hypothetical protein n=1 Tax=Micromonospora sp. WMMC273 TaxID=3015157 RepID=UPI0022B66644|nr:hypothetical protein [Micromonospora sp. WMMC273]MCZ7478923.1 hypothetical protein [Micromonospora sp. WMMC273]
MEQLPDLAMWSLIVGFGMPPIVAVVNQPRWPGWVRALITILVCVAAGAITAYLDGSLTDRRWTTAALIVGVAAIGSYRAFWRPSGIAPAIEQTSSPATPPGPDYHH